MGLGGVSRELRSAGSTAIRRSCIGNEIIRYHRQDLPLGLPDVLFRNRIL
jgi:hypothetical protein